MTTKHWRLHGFLLACTALAGCSSEPGQHDAVDAAPGNGNDTAPSGDAGAGDAAVFNVLPPYDQPGIMFAHVVDQTGTSPAHYVVNTSVGSSVQLPNGINFPVTTSYPSFPSSTTVTHYLVDGTTIAATRTTNSSGTLAYSPALTMFRAPMSPGDSWTQTVTVSGNTNGSVTVEHTGLAIETVTVPAGTFTCLKVHVRYTGAFSTFEYDHWWASGVGGVAYTMMNGLTDVTHTELVVAPHL